MGEIVGANREAVEALREGLRLDHIAGQFHHHVYLQSVLAPHQAMAGHLLQNFVALCGGAAEGHHRDPIGKAHLFAYPPQGLAFQAKCIAKFRGVVAAGASPAQHWVLLLGFKIGATEQLGVFVALEIGEPQNHRLREKSRGDTAHPQGQTI